MKKSEASSPLRTETIHFNPETEEDESRPAYRYVKFDTEKLAELNTENPNCKFFFTEEEAAKLDEKSNVSSSTIGGISLIIVRQTKLLGKTSSPIFFIDEPIFILRKFSASSNALYSMF